MSETKTGSSEPEIWQQYLDSSTGHFYYWNSQTGESTWTEPPSFKQATTIATSNTSTAFPLSRPEDSFAYDYYNVSVPSGMLYDRGERQMGHYFDVDGYRQLVNSAGGMQNLKKKEQQKVTKKQVEEFKKKKQEKKKKRNQWLYE